jgi:hypothetical protein
MNALARRFAPLPTLRLLNSLREFSDRLCLDLGKAVQLIENIREEFRKQPLTVIFGFIGALSVIANFIVYAFSLDAQHSKLFHSDVALLVTLCAVILTQGTVGFVFSRLNVVLWRLGVGFPVVLLAASLLILAWLLSFNAFWLAGYAAHASNVVPKDWYGIALGVSWLPVLYLQAQAFTRIDTGNDFSGFLLIMLLIVCNMFFGIVMATYFLGRIIQVAT